MNYQGIQQHFLPPTASAEVAVELLNRLKIKLILVTDHKDRLLGTLTDGDIRRGLLRHLPLNAPVNEFMETQPKVLGLDGSIRQARALMLQYGLNGVPQLDNEQRVVDLLGLKPACQRKDNAVFLMAGGFGKRLRPLTNNCPKPMLKVGDKPILETILEQFIDAGFHNFFISTHYLNEQIEAYFGDGANYGVSISYINEQTPLGTAGAIGLLPESAKQLPFLMMNGDLLTRVNFDELLEYHMREGSDVSVAVREYQMQVPFGVVQHQGSVISDIVEKPVQNYFINAGIYCISPSAAFAVDGINVLDMPDLIESRIKLGRKVSMFPIHEYWLDIGQLPDFEQAQIDYSSRFSRRQLLAARG
ncbi:nucleotidyltransferase family protein [Reinekea blandensis]|uniref:Nucleoside-diphosphate-sugar pyrophosphorylase n=1 Tax=Reinekea blandensis MED297 TaxID=314283 RepID=A4BEN1_9GAMM|nr:nucleotidyltransferase family protein [Reinekea blandensis]EAR09458.1 nucleoside-diphosphate-sugar pyrophosphorylase [Reinekea sp. MED297] [Reinekea blandensis MED297]